MSNIQRTHDDRYLGYPIEYGFTGVHKRLGVARRYIDWRGARVLDAGCGNGAYTVEIAREAASVVGSDIEVNRLLELARHARSLSHVSVAYAPCEQLPFADARFDVAFCIETLEHVNDEALTLRELTRVLRPGGSLVLFVPNKRYVFETHGIRFRGKYLKHSYLYPFVSWLPRALHARLAIARIYTSGDMRRLLKSWHNVRIDWMMPPLDFLNAPRLRQPLRRVISRIERGPLRRFGVSIAVIAQKPS